MHTALTCVRCGVINGRDRCFALKDPDGVVGNTTTATARGQVVRVCCVMLCWRRLCAVMEEGRKVDCEEEARENAVVAGKKNGRAS